MTAPSEGASRNQRPTVLLALFLLLHILNQVDRNLIASFAPEIVSELKLSLTQFGVLTGLAFTLFYAVMALLAGVVADRFGRRGVMAAGLGVWSLMTALSGTARSFGAMVAMRPIVATGEATLIPTATAILSERFPLAHRATAIGIFFMGIPIGIGASFIGAAWLGPILGWRNVFLLLGAVGLVLLPLVLRVRDVRLPLVEPQSQSSGALRSVARDIWQELRRNAELRLVLLGSVLMHVYLASTPFVKLWLTSERGFTSAHVGQSYGLGVIVLGVVGSLGGGILADAYARRFRGGRAEFLALFTLVLAPFMLAFRLVDPGTPLFWAGMGAGIIFYSGFYGPAFAVLQSAAPDRMRASLTGLSMLLVNVVALGLGGLLIGMASDALKAAGSHQSLSLPLLVADATSLMTMFCFAVIAVRTRRAKSL